MEINVEHFTPKKDITSGDHLLKTLNKITNRPISPRVSIFSNVLKLVETMLFFPRHILQ